MPQIGRAGKPPLGVIFDSAFGSRPDDALALAMLFGFDGLSDSRLLCIGISTSDLKAAQFCDVIAHFYRLPPPGALGGMGRGGLVIGLLEAGSPGTSTTLSAVLAKTNIEGKPAYPRTVETISDTADPLAQMRNVLNTQPDQNVVVVETGPITNLARLLALPSGKDLIARKVKYLVIAAGRYPDGPVDSSIRTDIPAARRVFAEWPTPIVACGAEVGNAIKFPASGIEKDFDWSPAHPVVDAYRAYQAMPYDAPAGAMAAVLYAVKPQENYFGLSPAGTIEVLSDGRTEFNATPGGKHKYLVVDQMKKASVIETITRLASLKPAAPAPRFRPSVNQQKDEVRPLPTQGAGPTPPPKKN
jgi:Inosine-uridine preferring nucleoside hydrolase